MDCASPGSLDDERVLRPGKACGRVIRHGARRRKQDEGDLIADGVLYAPDEFLADAASLERSIDREVGQVAAIAVVGQGAAHADENAIRPCGNHQIRRREHTGDARDVLRRTFDAGGVEHARDVSGVQREIVAVFDVHVGNV